MVAGRWYTPMQQLTSYDQTGIASWYGDDFHGKLTANGESYNMYSLSAAHKTMPLPTLVRVTNLENGRSVVVRVNDRGPFVKNRLIDLSYAAANSLGFMDKGTTRVRVQTLDQKPDLQTKPATTTIPDAIAATKPAPVPISKTTVKEAGIFVQLGAFGSEANANRLQQSLQPLYPTVRLHPKKVVEKTIYRVRIGPIENMKKVEETVISLQKNGYNQAVVVIE